MRRLVDAMNVIGSRPDGWWNDPDAAMTRFAEMLDAYSVQSGEEIEVVFDRQPKNFESPPHIGVVFAKWKGRNAADHEIEEMVRASATPSEILVVTSDKRLREKVQELGAKVEPSGRFRSRVEKALAG